MNVIYSQKKYIEFKSDLTDNGFIPNWLVVGPFDQSTAGFGNSVDTDFINELNSHPFVNKEEKSDLFSNGKIYWKSYSFNNNYFIDFNNAFGWIIPQNAVEKIWWSKTSYAFTSIESNEDMEAKLLFGSNSSAKIILNKEIIYEFKGERNAKIDDVPISIKLKKGINNLLVKVNNSHKNLSPNFFEEIKWEWGFYLRITNSNFQQIKNLKSSISIQDTTSSFDIIPTIFFKKINNALQQRFDIIINSNQQKILNGNINISIGNKDYNFTIEKIPFGESRHQIYLPEIKNEVKADLVFTLNNYSIKKEKILRPEKHYELHFMMLSHTDIGYTNPQPIVKELHCTTLDSVIKYCELYPDFKWTIETVWQLEQYEQSRPKENFTKLIDFIKEGRISLSPIYSNPFTGWISEEEMIQSLAKANEYKNKYGIEYNSAVYNDVPGESMFLSSVLNKNGIKFLANGINEIFNDYSLQKSLPKVFYWEGNEGNKIINYLNESYTEGLYYGLEKDSFAIEQRLWQRLKLLEQNKYDYELVLLNSAFLDNRGVPINQFLKAKEWNKIYEYPKFIISNLNQFSNEFIKRYVNKLPIIKADLTSPWDILNQSESLRFKKYKLIQNKILDAEKLSTLSWILNNSHKPFETEINKVYNSLLNFSGHGSGLEYGYGSPYENDITMNFRDFYINSASMNTEEILERAIYRLSENQESLEAEGIMVSNTLSWKRNDFVEIEFPENYLQQYQVYDLIENQIVPSFRKDYKLFFIAKDVPALGYKKYKLIPINEEKKAINKDLIINNNSIENQFYKITYNSETGEITSIINKINNKELIDERNEFPFALPIVERIFNKEEFKKLELTKPNIKIIDERPVRIKLIQFRENSLFENIEFTLLDSIDRIDLSFTINLEKLPSINQLEEYGVAFPFSISKYQNQFEVLGGFINPDDELFPGKNHDAFSIRNSIAIYNEKESISFSLIDNRVIRLRKTNSNPNGTLIVNLINNFPDNWNRQDKKEGKLELRFSFTYQSKTFNPSFTNKFGNELNAPLITKRSWYKSNPNNESFMNIENENVNLITIKSLENDNSYLLRLKNINSEEKIETKISSKLFNKEVIYKTDYFGKQEEKIEMNQNTIKININPNEIITLKIKLK